MPALRRCGGSTDGRTAVRQLTEQGYGADVELPAKFAAEDKALLTDPQTSGGLLVSCAPAAVGPVLDVFRRHGFAAAAEIGEVLPHGGGARLIVR